MAPNDTENYDLTSVAFYVSAYCQLPIAIVGIVGNFLAFVTFGRYPNRSPSTFYLKALAIADIIALIWRGIIDTTLPHLGVPTENTSVGMCKFIVLCNMASSVVSSWSLMVVAVDRAIALNFSTFYKSRCTPKTALVIIILLWVLVYAICSPLMYFFEYVGGVCGMSPDNPAKRGHGGQFTLFLNFGALFSIPLFGITLSNIFIVKILLHRKNIKKDLGVSSSSESKKSREENDVLLLLFSDCVAFAVLVTLVAIFCLCCLKKRNTRLEKEIYGLMEILCELFSCLESGIRFFLYMMFSRKFRQTFFSVFRGKRAVWSDRSDSVRKEQSTVLQHGSTKRATDCSVISK